MLLPCVVRSRLPPCSCVFAYVQDSKTVTQAVQDAKLDLKQFLKTKTDAAYASFLNDFVRPSLSSASPCLCEWFSRLVLAGVLHRI